MTEVRYFGPMIILDERLPIEEIRALSPFVLIAGDLSVISEHQSTPEAVRARARYAAENGTSENGNADAAIYRRTRTHWVRY